MKVETRIILLPGLGADKRLFDRQTAELTNVYVPDWIEPLGDESLSSYARRWGTQLGLGPSDIVGGMSFGGQLALELARHNRLKAAVLIASHTCSSELTTFFKLQSQLLGGLPDAVVSAAMKNVAIPRLHKEENLSEDCLSLLRSMVDDLDMGFFRWATRAAAQWDYRFNPQDFDCPIFQIRGENDSIIPPPTHGDYEQIPGAGHLINFTHAPALNSWLQSICMEKVWA
jgi:pimeloyl-ACP methyl ester carboxylesterase